MPSNKITYHIAAREHLERAQDLFDRGSYYLVHYLSGIAVECHLRAHLHRKTRKFDARHDLELLAKESGFLAIVPAEDAARFSSVFQTINKRWRSNHRYYSEKQLLDYLSSVNAEFGSRGDRWKNNARTMLNCAHTIIKQGEAKWSKG